MSEFSSIVFIIMCLFLISVTMTCIRRRNSLCNYLYKYPSIQCIYYCNFQNNLLYNLPNMSFHIPSTAFLLRLRGLVNLPVRLLQ